MSGWIWTTSPIRTHKKGESDVHGCGCGYNKDTNTHTKTSISTYRRMDNNLDWWKQFWTGEMEASNQLMYRLLNDNTHILAISWQEANHSKWKRRDNTVDRSTIDAMSSRYSTNCECELLWKISDRIIKIWYTWQFLFLQSSLVLHDISK